MPRTSLVKAVSMTAARRGGANGGYRGSDPSFSVSIHMPEHLFQSSRAPQQIIRSGESVTGGPIHFIGKDMWVKLAGGDLPGSITVMEDVSPPHHGPPLHAHPFEEGEGGRSRDPWRWTRAASSSTWQIRTRITFRGSRSTRAPGC
jgi:hypothetical protein